MSKKVISVSQVLVFTALYLTAFANFAFFRNLQVIAAGSDFAVLHMVSFALLLFCATVIFLSLLCWGRGVKPMLIFLLILSSVTAYFMDTFNVIIGQDMLLNAMATNTAETADLITPRLFGYLALLGLIPAFLVWRLPLAVQTFKAAMGTRLKLGAGALVTMVVLLAISSAFYISIIREHKALRYYTNPITPIYSAYRLGQDRFVADKLAMQPIGEDARIPQDDTTRELIIMVVGEASRADRYSLNGYERQTNLRLAERNVVSFTQVSSCGTSTAVSVPCMFALKDRKDFSEETADQTGNLLDVVAYAGVHTLWRDNNSNSKGVSDRVLTEDFRSPELNPICDIECRDEGMLAGLQGYIDQKDSGDILIVLHQMGSHGPAYYKRYPPAFRVFIPTCDTAQLDECSEEEINNAYDNTIVYTDYFLSLVIDFLHSNDERFETAMMFVGDHGESLGEFGMYLHGLPYAIAPETQTQVPVIMWFGRNYDSIEMSAMQKLRSMELSHDNIFHTMLGMFEIDAEIYDPQKDILEIARNFSGIPAEYAQR